MKTLLDNHHQKLVDYLCKHLGECDAFRLVSAYFSIRGYAALADKLEKPEEIRFLLGDPSLIDAVAGDGKPVLLTKLQEEGMSFAPSHVWGQENLAWRCANWIRQNKVQVRSMIQNRFLHGKMYHMQQKENSAATVGSSNFTSRGLGTSASSNLEINIVIEDKESRDELVAWFDDLWNDKAHTQDVKKEVLEVLLRLYRPYDPEFVYYKTLYEIFRDEIEKRKNSDETSAAGVAFKDTEIWKALYNFQKDGAKGILHRLQQYNGCILADSVGLGKTYTALAVIKRFEMRKKKVLVLCPKKLEENWRTYQASADRTGNPLREDDFQYRLLAHTDLSRDSGNASAGNIKLSDFPWGEFDLVVIDESHNFRNDTKAHRRTEPGRGEYTVRSRYQRLVEDVIQKGSRNTKVLMLSATPVNTSLIDLRNQINIMAAGRDNAFESSLEIGSVKSFFAKAEKQFKKWEEDNKNNKKKDRDQLLETLGGEVIHLLDGVTIARSRRQIKDFYPEFKGKFPIRRVDNLYPHTDTQKLLEYEALNNKMKALKFFLYRPSLYVKSDKVREQLDAERKEHNYNQKDRERFLAGMMRINFMKRLESSAHALELTLERTIGKVKKQIGRIDKYLKTLEDSQTELVEVDLDDEDFVVNRRVLQPFHLKDLDVEKWRKHLIREQEILQGMWDEIKPISPVRDNKLRELKEQIREKSKNPKNKKVLVFTAFKDTAEYLYEQLGGLAEDGGLAKEIGLPMAMVAGDVTRTQKGDNKFLDILNNFSPMARKIKQHNTNEEIHLIIATDCVSEGQNLQDCDMVLNYDIHWNPVRLIQRFGRIDRIGSQSPTVRMWNFWPTKNMEYYLELESRVTARMALVDATTTLEDSMEDEQESNQAEADSVAQNKLKEVAQGELNFRNERLRQLQTDGEIEAEDDNSISMSDLTLEHFIMQLMRYLKDKEAELQKTPAGIHAVVNAADAEPRQAGAIFLFRHTEPPENTGDNVLRTHYLLHVTEDGVYTNHMQVHKTLGALSELATSKDPLKDLCREFNGYIETGEGKKVYDEMALLAAGDIRKTSQVNKRQKLRAGSGRGNVLQRADEIPTSENLELVTWFAIRKEN